LRILLLQPAQNDIVAAIDEIYRRGSRRAFATLIRLVGGFDLAKEALHEAFRAAVEQWPNQGIPQNHVAWLVSAGRFKAIDQIRRDARSLTNYLMILRSKIIISRTRHAPTSAVALGATRRRAPRTSTPSHSRNKIRSGGSCRAALQN
jgi:DNA-directed RNA polymerase specialized sigma24 family protein